MPSVLNRHTDHIPTDAVYIGRGTKWGNPFIVGVHGGRKTCLELYRQYLAHDPVLIEAVKRELAGKDLVCSCKPKECHGDILLQIANEDDTLQGPLSEFVEK